MRTATIIGVGVTAAAGAVVAALAIAIASCAATPTNVAVRTFEGPKKVDVVCVAVNNADDGGPLAASQIHGLSQDECAPAPTDFAALNAPDGSTLPNHLYAVVTQTTRGELAVVDLTGGAVVDEDRSTPGINFIPVGSSPTDVVVALDGQMTFVGSADPNKPAIYGIPTGSHVGPDGGLAGALLGDSTGLSPPPPLPITGLEACSLPQPPQDLAVAPIGGTDGGAPKRYVIVAVLAGLPGVSAKVVAIDPTPLLRGGGVDAGASDAATATPGILTPCSTLGFTALSAPLASAPAPGPAWPDGVPYADAGSLANQEPSAGPSCASSMLDAGVAPATGTEAGEAEDAGAAAGGSADGGGEPDAGALLSATSAFPTTAALRDDLPILYVADGALSVIHEIDLTDPTHPRELSPLLATSITQPTRQVSVGAIAISPTTRDYRRYLYAVDQGNGSLMVFDVTDPGSPPRTPLQRPHAELNPLEPPDRLTFAAPVATVGFVQHDWPFIPPGPNGTTNPDQIHAYTGLLCNPNPNAHPDAGAFLDLGAYYRADQALVIEPTGTVSTVQGFPYRLRGIFGFATLSNGQAVAIDVDDWDAPCRRPEPMALTGTDPASWPSNGMTGLLDIPQPAATSSADLDPYHAPNTYNSNIPESPAVTQEEFFPVSAPHRIRSQYLLRNDPASGNHIPYLLGLPELFDAVGAPISGSGTQPPLILPTVLPPGFIDPTLIANPTEANPMEQTKLPAPATVPSGKAAAGVRLSFDDPTVATNQDWTVTYEGALPLGQTNPADIETTDGYSSLTFTIGTVTPDGGVAGNGLPASTNGPGFCERGVEDWTIGQTRAAAVMAATQQAMVSDGGGVEATLPQWTADYVEVTDQILPQGDPYWSVPFKDEDGGVVNDCWEGTYDKDGDPQIASERYNACAQTFGAPSSCPSTGMSLTQASGCQNASAAADPDDYLTRDFPIVRAYDDHLVVGRFGWTAAAETTENRVIVGPDPSNVPFLRLMRCCFHHESAFKVRAGGEWVTVGQTGLGFLHHVIAAPQGTDPANPISRPCVLSCDPNDVLLNGRSFDVPACAVPPSFSGITRDNPLAMENPFLSFVTWSGCGTLQAQADGGGPAAGAHTLTARDLTWKFSVRGAFTPLFVSLTGSTATAVSPQSMRFIESFGQLAIVDGELQGLVLIDLNTLTFAHNPYY